MERQRGFTLIELLTVVMIVVLLMGMLLPMISMARRSAAITSTRSLIKRVSMALESFRSDVGTYPYQDHVGVSFPDANRLAFHLGHDLTPSELTELRDDAAQASGRFDPSSSFGTMVMQRTNLDPREVTTEDAEQSGIAATVNRMAATRARVAIYAGATQVTGFKAYGGYDHGAERLVPNAASRGFARDYLGDDLSPKEVKGDAIVDRWGQPLIYVCPVLPGVHASLVADSVGRSVYDAKALRPGAATVLDGANYGLSPRGRTQTAVLGSDIRTSAAPAYLQKPELWSSGPDRRCAPERNDRANADNISVEPYTRGLQ